MKRIAITLTCLAIAGMLFVTFTQAQNDGAPAGGQAPQGGLQLGNLESFNPDDVEVDMAKVSYALGTNMGKDLLANLIGPEKLNAQQVSKGISEAMSGKIDSSYAVGVGIGAGVKRDLQNPESGVTFDMAEFQKGVTTALTGGESAMTDEDIQQAMGAFQQKMFLMQMKNMQKQQEETQKEALANAAVAKAYLEANAQKPDVKTTDTGLQYIIEKQGDGPSPKATDTVKVHYKGMLTDGSVFDSSYDRGEPAVFPVGNLIPAWVEALPMMKVGSKWKLFVPPDLGYGPQGSPPRIPGNAVLIFEMELLGIEKSAE